MEGIVDIKTPNRKSIRYPGVDYSVPGYYFITICVQDRKHHFGSIKDGEIKLSAIGEIAKEYWMGIPRFHPNVVIDEFVIMPDHMHGIIEIIDNAPRSPNTVGADISALANGERGHKYVPLQSTLNSFQHIVPGSISAIVRGYKAGVTKWCRQNGHDYFIWQKNYYEHIIRHDRALQIIRDYIRGNPWNWDGDGLANLPEGFDWKS